MVAARRLRSTDAYVTLLLQAQEGRTRIYSVEPYIPGSGTTKLEYSFTASNGATVISKGSGELSIEANGSTSGSAGKEVLQIPVHFRVVGRHVAKMRLGIAGRLYTLAGTWVPPTRPDDNSPGELGYTQFTWQAYDPATGLPPDNSEARYEYTLDTAVDAQGRPMLDEMGNPLVQTGAVQLKPGDPARQVQLFDKVKYQNQSKDVVISRYQFYSAFGEVVEERDERVAARMQAMLGGRELTADEQAAARTTLRYNTLRKLVAKIDPHTSVTGANGQPNATSPPRSTATTCWAD